MPTITKKVGHWLHLAGKSKLKGTDVIINTWLKNPDFPPLTIIQRNAVIQDKEAHNLSYIKEFIDHHRLKELINQCPVHLCPSATEGFGHSMGEALSCGAIIITTDAPPMNELVTGDRGFLVKPVSRRSIKLATAYDIDDQGLENTVRSAVMSKDHKRLMENARNFFISNDRFFKHEMISRINALMG
jgi:glycosyltransferase involved in cell wall biosynthesis